LAIYFLLTDIATEYGITDERDADGRFPSVSLSVKHLSMDYESHIYEFGPSVNMLNLVVFTNKFKHIRIPFFFILFFLSSIVNLKLDVF